MKDKELRKLIGSRVKPVSYTHLQNYNLVPILNVYENIVLPVELDGDTVDQKFMDEVVYLSLIHI